MLSNVNSDKNQILQLIMVGKPELRAMLQLPQLKQFAQRVSVSHHLDALSSEETYQYVRPPRGSRGRRSGAVQRKDLCTALVSTAAACRA
jgi:type II secretory pathway predicted ATPase ExeA